MARKNSLKTASSFRKGPAFVELCAAVSYGTRWRWLCRAIYEHRQDRKETERIRPNAGELHTVVIDLGVNGQVHWQTASNAVSSSKRCVCLAYAQGTGRHVASHDCYFFFSFRPRARLRWRRVVAADTTRRGSCHALIGSACRRCAGGDHNLTRSLSDPVDADRDTSKGRTAQSQLVPSGSSGSHAPHHRRAFCHW